MAATHAAYQHAIYVQRIQARGSISTPNDSPNDATEVIRRIYNMPGGVLGVAVCRTPRQVQFTHQNEMKYLLYNITHHTITDHHHISSRNVVWWRDHILCTQRT